MKIRLVSVVAALAVLVGLPVFAVKVLHHHASGVVKARSYAPPAPVVLKYPSEYVGIVSNDVAAFDSRCQCRPNAAIHYIKMGGPVNVSLAKKAIDEGAVPLLELEPFNMPLTS